MPDLLPLPPRQPKPRATGLTHVLDCGLGAAEVDSFLEVSAAHVDLVRLGWGSALVTGSLQRKLDIYRAYDIPVMLGGTITELAWLHDRIDPLCDWIESLGMDRIEVSSGTVPIPPDEKARLIERLTSRFAVYAEVGEKDAAAIMAPYRWVELIQQALDSGAELVICEGRASGTAGLYRETSETRTGLVEEIVHDVGLERVVFEAPRTAQQAFFVGRFGNDVNLGNIPPAEVVSLETLRLGLRSETIPVFNPDTVFDQRH